MTIRLLRAMTTLTVVLGLAAASCGDDDDGGESATSVVEETTTTAGDVSGSGTTEAAAASCDPEGRTITLTVLERTEATARAGEAALEEQYPGLEVDVTVFTAGSYNELAQTVVADKAAGQEPDVVETGLGNVTFAVDALDARALDPGLLSPTYDERYLAAGTVDEELYVVPWQASVPLWYYNKDLYAAAGLDPEAPPETLDQVLDHARAIAAATDAEPLLLPADRVGDWFFQNAVASGGGELIGADGTAAFDTPEGLDGLSLWSTAVAEGLRGQLGFADGLAAFLAGQVGIAAGSSSVLALTKDGVGDTFEWGVFVHPVAEGVDPTWAIGGAGFSVLSEDDCEAQYGTELIAAMLSPELIAEANQSTGYAPVDTAALELLEDFYAENPEWAFAQDFEGDLTTWGGWRGERSLEANLLLQEALQRLAAGEPVDVVVAETAEQVDAIVQ